VDSVRRDLAKLGKLTASLAAEDRALFDTVPAAQRRSIRVAIEAVTERYRLAAAKHEQLAREVLRLRQERESLGEQLRASEGAEQSLLSDLTALRAGTRDWQARHQAFQERLAVLTEDLKKATQGAAGRVAEARAARARYWAEVGDFFQRHKLGSPRDYTAPVAWDEARTERRTRAEQGEDSPHPAMAERRSRALPLHSRRAPAALSVRIIPARPAGNTANGQELQVALQRWSRELQDVGQAQSELSALVEETRSLERQAESAAQLAREHEALQASRDGWKEKMAWQAYSGERKLRDLEKAIDRAFEAAKEAAYWKLMSKSFEHLLKEQAGADRVAKHFVWVVRGYKEFLTQELPRATELLGSGASPKDQTEYDELSRMGQKKPVDWAVEVFAVSPEDVRKIGELAESDR
jgi:hypothetical protein